MYSGGLILLSKANAIEFVDACELASIPILGIDGFYIVGNFIQPSLENSIDFTSSLIKPIANIYQFSKQFIANKAEDVFFEVVC